VHGTETPMDVTLPRVDGAQRFVSLWSSADEVPDHSEGQEFAPGAVISMPGTSMRLFRVE